MKKKKLISIAIFVLFALFVLFWGVKSIQGVSERTKVKLSDTPKYAERGPYSVGFQEEVIQGINPLEITIWYPAQITEETDTDFMYQYKIKMGDPLGMVTITQYQGYSVPGTVPDKSSAPYPLVILSPGFSISSSAYAWLAEHLASYGFIVISPDHNENLDPENQLWQRAITRPQDIQIVLSFAEEELQKEGPLQGLVDINTVAVIGHSYGGYTTLAAAGAQIDTESFQTTCLEVQGTDEPGAWLCEMLLPKMANMAELAGLKKVPDGLWPNWGDERVKAIVPIAGDAFFFGQPGLSQISVPVLAIGGTADVDSPYLWGTHPSFEYTSGSRKAEVALIDAEHMIFTGRCESVRWYLKFLSGEFCTDPSWDREYAHEITKHFAAAFLLAELRQDQSALSALSPAAVDLPGISYETKGY